MREPDQASREQTYIESDGIRTSGVPYARPKLEVELDGIMDRISALRNVEDALADFESGEADLEATERRVLNVLRTYATEFEDDDLCAYRASGTDRTEGLVVVAESETEARTRVADIVDAGDPANLEFDLERVG